MKRVLIYQFAAFLCLVPGSGAAQQCESPAVGIGCVYSYVRTASVPEAEVMRQFRVFAKAENLQCNPTLGVGRPIWLSCTRDDGLFVDIWRDGMRLQIMSQAVYGLKGPDTLKTFNRRMAEFLRSHFKDAVETDEEPRT